MFISESPGIGSLFECYFSDGGDLVALAFPRAVLALLAIPMALAVRIEPDGSTGLVFQPHILEGNGDFHDEMVCSFTMNASAVCFKFHPLAAYD